MWYQCCNKKSNIMTRNIKLIFFILLEVLSTIVIAQNSKNKVFIHDQTLPKFNGGENENEFRKFIGNTLVYPESAFNDGLEGKVFVSFIIDSLGNVSDVKILKGIRADLDEAVINAVKLSPKWTPATLNGRPISIRWVYPVVFVIEKRSIRQIIRAKRYKSKSK